MTPVDKLFIDVLEKAEDRHREPPTHNPETKYEALLASIMEAYKQTKVLETQLKRFWRD
jgi:hypothetical protein